MRKKVMLVFGTRPEAIKMCPLVKEFQKRTDEFDAIVCVTGQHREMLDQVLKIFEVTPDYDLNIMKQGQDLTDITTRVLIGMRNIFKEMRPDVVLVHGDTTTSTAAAMAAFYAQIPVGHVEAGLRTHNIYSPWPEEMNRQITSRIATYNFSPTPLSALNLKTETAFGNIYVTGNTVIDALHMVVDKLQNNKVLVAEQEKVLAEAGYDVKRLANGKKLVLITGHRRENFGDGFIHICTAIRDLKNDPNGIKYLEAILPGFKYAHYDIWKNIINGNPEYDNVSAIVADYRQSELSRTQPNYAINLRNKAIKEAISNTPVTKPLTLLGLGGLAIDNGLQKIGSLLLQDMITQPPMGKFQDKYNNNKYAKQLDKEIRPLLAKEYDQSGNSIESLTDSFDTQSVGQSDAQTIRGMSGTTRALVINFNREIVSMPTTINANDVEDIKQQLEPAIEDMIVRGLTIALNNSTRMI